MIEAFVGLVGGGKTFSSVKRMCNYMSLGGVVVSNILLTGYDPDTKSFSPDSPVLKYLRDALKWEYQYGQYQYISFDEMASLPGWFHRVPGGQSRDKRTFLCIDEATDLFDSLDRGKLNNDSVYRELFRFLRLSRHAHIDVLFICQDLNAINIRLRGLVGVIWRSTDMSNFRIGGLKIAIPINCFLLQQFDRSGKLELKREFVAKDARIFDLYQSEAFHDSMGVTFSPPVKDGRITKGKKRMNIYERLLFLLLAILVFFLLFRLSRMSSEFDRRFEMLSEKISSQPSGNNVSVKNGRDSENRENSNSFLGFLSSGSSLSETPENFVNEKPSRSVVRGVFSFTETPFEKYCYIDGNLFRVGYLTEYGLCKVVTKNVVICVDGLHETVILPRADVGGASAVSFQGVPAEEARAL